LKAGEPFSWMIIRESFAEKVFMAKALHEAAEMAWRCKPPRFSTHAGYNQELYPD